MSGKPKAAVTPGTAARKGEAGKKSHYRDGVIPFVMETGGRLGGPARDWLQEMAHRAKTHGKRTPNTNEPRRLNPMELQGRIEAIMYREMASKTARKFQEGEQGLDEGRWQTHDCTFRG